MAAPLGDGPDPRPTRDQVLMRQAQIVAERSTCTRAHVGVVIAHESRVVSQGYNGAPAGMAHCDHTCSCHPPYPEFDNLLGIDRKPQPEQSICSIRNGPCLIAVHAEANAIAFAAKHGVATAGASLYTTMAPCLPCSQLIINAGIVRVVFGREYRYDEGVQLLMEAGVSVVLGL